MESCSIILCMFKRKNWTSLQSDVRKLKERLHTIYTGGSVVPLPFLRASDASPLALLSSSASSVEAQPEVRNKREEFMRCACLQGS